MRLTEPYTIFQRTLPSGKQVFYYQFRYTDGRRSNPKSTGCSTLSQAKRFCQKLYNSGEFEKTDAQTFEQFTARFFDENSEYCKYKKALNNKALKPKTLESYKTMLDFQLAPYFNAYELDKITTDIVKKWVVWACEQWSPKTVNNAQGVLNIIFESAIDKELMHKNPLRRIGMRKIEKRKRDLLTQSELKSLYLMDWPNETERQAFLLACITGMRIGEVCALQKQNIKKNYLDICHNYSKKYGLQETTKTGINRCVPFPKEFTFPHSDSEWVFDGKELNKPISPHCIYNAFIKRLRRLKIDSSARGITIHSLRDFFVSYLRSENVSDPKIRAIVGHADTTMTDLYTYWKSDMFPEVYEAQKKLYDYITGGQNAY